MAKKIYDIKPPKVAHKVEKELKEMFAGDKRTKNSRRKKEKTFPWKAVALGAGVLVFIAVVYLFFKLPKANVQIWPKLDSLSFTQKIAADKSADSVDMASNSVPAQYIESEKKDSQDFPSTGNADNTGMATGTITIYNKYDPPSPFTLKAGTHFLSDSGKYFITLAKVVVPAAKKSGGKITPGSIQVKVQAAEGGEAYNISASKFSVPKLSGTNYYYAIYADSKSAMAGGYAGKVKKVTDDDIQGAKDTLTKKLLADAQADLKTKVPADYVLLDNAVSTSTVNASTQTKSGAVVESFTYSADVKAGALIFKKSDLEEFAKNYIVSQMPDSKTMLDKSFKITYTADSVDVTGGKASLTLNFSASVYSSVDANSLTSIFRNENASQINDTVSNVVGDGVQKIKVNFWPFWVTKAPNNQKAITIDLKFE